LRRFLARLANTAAGREDDERLKEEIEEHMALLMAENIRAGLPLAEAHRQAVLKFGGVEVVREDYRAERRLFFIDTLAQDVRYGVRMLRRNRAFTAVAILTLALGVGVNTAIFSIVNAVLLRPLPYPDPDSLMRIAFSNPGVGLHDVGYSIPEIEDLKRSGVFEDVSVLEYGPTNMMGPERPERAELLAVSSGYFPMLRVKPQLGRLLGPQDAAPGLSEAIVISDGFWKREYGRNPAILGRKLVLDNDPYTIVGVLPPQFRHPGKTEAAVEIFVACGYAGDPFPKPARNVRFANPTIGRLEHGVSLRQAQEKLNALAGRLRKEYPDIYPAAARWNIEIEPLRESLVGPVRTLLLLLMAAAILIVLIASVNIANLLLARASARRQEIAVRLALGAGPGRVIRQMLTESLILSLAAGVVGVSVALGASAFLARLVATWVPRLSEVTLDWRVLGFAFAVSILTGLVFGVAPAMRAAKTNLSATTREGARGSSSAGGQLLIISELALAIVLMMGAGLLLRTFWELLNECPGFNSSKVVAASFYISHPNDPRRDPYFDLRSRTVLMRDVLRRMREVPGVELAAMTTTLPVASEINMAQRGRQSDVVVEDNAVESSEGFSAELIAVSPDYFGVMQARLAAGRFFLESDDGTSGKAVIVDESTARRYWPGRNPIGRHIRLGQGASLRYGTDPALPWMTVVGVVRDIKHDGLDVDGISHVYRPIYEYPERMMSLVVRTSLPATALARPIRGVIQKADPRIPVFGIRNMNEVIDSSLAPRRFSAALVGAFAALALLLASVGVYGLLAYMVGQRSHEIGIRIALGASRGDIVRLILGRGIRLAAVGIAAGVAFSAATSTVMAGLLYGVRPHDPTVFVAVPLLFAGVAVLASYIPARRAARMEPLSALKVA
jgi:putative ABC transport system permease protein